MGELIRFIAESNLTTVIFGVGTLMFLLAVVRLEGKVEVAPIMRGILAIFGLFLMAISFGS